MVKTKPTSGIDVKQLQRGQVWRLEDTRLHIKHVGHKLVHYQRIKGDFKRAPTMMSPINDIEDYLRKHHAVLLQDGVA